MFTVRQLDVYWHDTKLPIGLQSDAKCLVQRQTENRRAPRRAAVFILSGPSGGRSMHATHQEDPTRCVVWWPRGGRGRVRTWRHPKYTTITKVIALPIHHTKTGM